MHKFTCVTDYGKGKKKLLYKFGFREHHKPKIVRIVHAIPNSLALSMIFFISNIAKIRETLLSAKSDSNIYPEPTPPAAPHPLLTFSQISESNASKLIRSSPRKSCDLESCPTQIVKDSADILAESITTIIDLPLAEGKFPDAFNMFKLLMLHHY